MNKQDYTSGKRALKNVSVQQLETAIAAALFKITSEKYEVDIKRFDLDLEALGDLDELGDVRDGAVIELRAVAANVVADGTPDPLARAKAACCLERSTDELLAVPVA